MLNKKLAILFSLPFLFSYQHFYSLLSCKFTIFGIIIYGIGFVILSFTNSSFIASIIMLIGVATIIQLNKKEKFTSDHGFFKHY